jgi:hypothetical protein
MLSPMPIDLPPGQGPGQATQVSSPPQGPPGGSPPQGPPGGSPPPGPLLAQAGPLATPAAEDGGRKRLLIGLAALVVVVAVAATVYVTAFSNSSSTGHLTGGLTKPTIGAGTSPGAPATPGTRRQHHHAGTSAHTADPTATGAPASSSAPGRPGHPGKKPTSPASVQPTSSGASQSPTQKATPTPTPTPPPIGTWECGDPAGVAGTGETLTACIEYTAGALVVEARLANVNSAGQAVEVALSSPTDGTYNSWQTACPAPKVSTTCTSQVITITGPGAGHWYSSAGLSISGTIQPGLVAKSPIIYFPG